MPIPRFDPEKDIQVVNLNEIKDMGARPYPPFALLIWNNKNMIIDSEKDAELLKEAITLRYNGTLIDYVRDLEIQKRFPLRQIRLDMCECGHDDSDHDTELSLKGVEDGACNICVCKKFTLPINKQLD